MKIGACAVLAMVWASCYSFELFPWTDGTEWWHLPHLTNILDLPGFVLLLAIARAVDGTFKHVVPVGTINPPAEEEGHRPSQTTTPERPKPIRISM